MNTYNQLKEMVETWKANGASKSEIVIKGAEACIGWPYCWGAIGIACTVANRKRYMANTKIAEGDANLIKKRCQVLNGQKDSCDGCKYHPNDDTVDMNDCIGFVKERFADAGVHIINNGCTLAWNNKTQWTQKGLIKNMPDTVCCVFQQSPADSTKMQHIGIHVGGGRIIHCSVEVKTGSISEKAWTHFAIPKGMDEVVPAPVVKPTLRKGSSGEYVTLLQTKLIMLGYNLGVYGADGKFGAKTLEAVKKFQRDRGLTVDGVVGSATWESLDGINSLEELYTVHIPHLHKTDANELALKYSGASIEKE